MKLEVEEENNKLTIEMEKEHTIANLLRKALWEVGAEAGYDKGHPYIGKSKLVIKGENPKKLLDKAVAKVKNDLKEFKAEFEESAE